MLQKSSKKPLPVSVSQWNFWSDGLWTWALTHVHIHYSSIKNNLKLAVRRYLFVLVTTVDTLKYTGDMDHFLFIFILVPYFLMQSPYFSFHGLLLTWSQVTDRNSPWQPGFRLVVLSTSKWKYDQRWQKMDIVWCDSEWSGLYLLVLMY